MAQYSKQTWNAGDAITAQRMNTIETGLADASAKAYTNATNI